MRRAAAALVVLVMVAMWAAAPAYATYWTLNVSARCAAGSPTSSATLHPGDTLAITGCASLALSTSDPVLAAHLAAQTATSLTLDSTVPGGVYPGSPTGGFYYIDFSSSPLGYSYISVTVTGGTSVPSVPAAVAVAPDRRSLLQQVPVPARGCAVVVDEPFAWGTGLSGGWGESWAEWNRGPVCTRSLLFGEGGWTLG